MIGGFQDYQVSSMGSRRKQGANELHFQDDQQGTKIRQSPGGSHGIYPLSDHLSGPKKFEVDITAAADPGDAQSVVLSHLSAEIKQLYRAPMI